MEKIKELIKRNELTQALKLINEKIENPLFLGTKKQHELLFAKGIVNITKYEDTNTLENKFYWAAKEDFIHADNLYKSLVGHQNH